MKRLFLSCALLVALALSACASPGPYDYSAFKRSNPKSILVLPPLNDSPEVDATPGFWANTLEPLAESGFYVFPIGAVNETFMRNGLTQAGDIHNVGLDKLRKIFGADAVLYLKVTDYGSSFKVIDSVTRVSAEAVLRDGKTGEVLWEGKATADNREGNSQRGSGLLGVLITAALNQISSQVTDLSYDIAGITAERLLRAGNRNGILYGPRSAHYGEEAQQ